jgi:hypothetical protein
MGLYPKFDPPAHMQDLGRVPGLTEQWSKLSPIGSMPHSRRKPVAFAE